MLAPRAAHRPVPLVFLLAVILGLTAAAAASPARTSEGPSPEELRNPSPNRFITPFEAIFDRRPENTVAERSAPGGDMELGGSNESSVAVNPLDPMNIAYASLRQMRVSTDGGSTFLPPVATPFPNTHYIAGDPSVAFDSQGRLFWTYVGTLGDLMAAGGWDLFVARCDPATGAVLPGYPVNVSAQAGFPASAGYTSDKEWLAADSWAGSPFRDRLYLAWSDLTNGATGSVSRLTRSTDQGMTWSAAVQLGAAGTAFKWPVHVAVAPNGDVYAADHRQPNWNSSVPSSGTVGRIHFFRSTDGGATFATQANAATSGDADFSFNYQFWSSGTVPGSVTLLQGSAQPWILPDPLVPGTVSVVYCDDPDDNLNSADAADVFLVRSTDAGATWLPRTRVDSGPEGTFQIMPNAMIDRSTGAIAVTWMDNRSGAVNADGHYLLDLHGAVSTDGGASFGNDFRISDLPFDPDAGAPCRYNCAEAQTGVWAASATDAWACGFQGLMHWDGTAWTAASNGGTQIAVSVWGSDAAHVWTCGTGGEIRFFNGSTWTGQASGTTQTLAKIAGRSQSDVFAVGSGGTILHWDGVSWKPQASGTTEMVFRVCPLPGGSTWAVGWNGTVLRHDGITWSPEAVGLTNVNLSALWANSDTDVWIGGQSTTIWHGDGSSWTPMEPGTSFFIGAWGSSPTDVYVGSFSGIVHWNGSSFETQTFSSWAVNEIFGTSATNIFATGAESTIGHFDGTEWLPQANPGQATNPTLRIGEYNGIAGGVVGVTTWVGNTLDASRRSSCSSRADPTRSAG